MRYLDEKMLTEGIKDVDSLERLGRELAKDEKHSKNPRNKMTSSQIRRFFGALKRIQADFKKLKSEIILLEPKLAYAVGRDKDKKSQKNKTKIDLFYDEVSPLIRSIHEDEPKFKNFVNIVEAVVAYHKAACGD